MVDGVPVAIPLRQRAIHGLRWNGASSAVLIGLQCAQLLVLSHCLPPADFGLMTMCLVVMAIADSFTGAGAGLLLIHREEIDRELLSTSAAVNLAVGLAVALVVIIGAPWIAGRFAEPRLVPLVRMLACSIFVASFGVNSEMLLRRNLDFRGLAHAQVIASAGSTAVAISMALSGIGVLSLVTAFVVRNVMVTALLTWQARKLGAMHLGVSRSSLRTIMAFGCPQMAERLLNIAADRMDFALIGAMMGAEQLGYYAFASNLISIPQTRLNSVVTAVALPVFARLQHDKSAIGSAYCKILRGLTTINAPILIGVIPLASLAIPLVFGTRWISAVPLVQILALVGLGRAIGNPVGSLVIATGAVRLSLAWNVLVIALTWIATFAGARLTDSTKGVAIGLIVLQFALVPATYWLLVRRMSMAQWGTYADAIGRPAAAAAAAAGIAWLVTVLPISGVALLATQLGVLIGSYVSIVRVLDPKIAIDTIAIIRGKWDPNEQRQSNGSY
jgi:PST family polysaccharide transporter/lipopolysaccharide exporter